MGARVLGFVPGGSVPVSLREMLRQGIGPSLAVGSIIFAILLPLKWLVPEGLLGTLAMVALAGISLLLAGLAFIVSVDERAALRAAARRIVS